MRWNGAISSFHAFIRLAPLPIDPAKLANQGSSYPAKAYSAPRSRFRITATVVIGHFPERPTPSLSGFPREREAAWDNFLIKTGSAITSSQSGKSFQAFSTR